MGMLDLISTRADVDFIPGRIRAADSGSSYAFDKLKRWVSICNEHHDCLSLNIPSNLPTRALDIATRQNMVFLRETAGQKGSYIALSHSWGSTHRLTLTRANMATLKGGIMLSDIPKTFQDAVQIARELKIAHLWIDSLCIVQDDVSDWEVEASHMGDVYAGSYLTVAALGSQDDSTGCFPDASTRYSEPFVSVDVRSTGRRSFFHAAPVARWDEKYAEEYAGLPTLSGRCVWGTDEVTNHDGGHMSWLYVTPEWMPPSVKEKPKTYLLGEFGGSLDPIADESLSERGWTLQERLLAARTIHYGRTEMYWECQHCVLAEDGAMLRREFTTADDLCSPNLREGGKDRNWRWRRLVEQYSTRKLTMASDKLPALSGLAHMIATKTCDTYLAGLWKSNLLSELNWAVKAYEATHQCTEPEHDAAMPPAIKSAVKYPAKYRAPSWSWASLDAEIEYRGLEERPLSKIIDAQVQPVGKDNFGHVASGRLKLKVSVHRHVTTLPQIQLIFHRDLSTIYTLANLKAARA